MNSQSFIATALLAASFAASAQEEHKAIHLVADTALLDALAGKLPTGMRPTPRENLDEAALVESLAKGEGLVWIGRPEGVPKDLCVGAFRASEAAVAIAESPRSPLPMAVAFSDAVTAAAYIAPPKELPQHNIDEEVRADFLPLLEARDRYGNVVGYPGLAMGYHAPSLAAGRFKGSECFFYFFDEPLKALDAEGWATVLQGIAIRRASGLQVASVQSSYASYRAGERVQIRARIQNRRAHAVSVVLKFYLQAPGATAFTPLLETRRVAERGSETEALCDFPAASATGMYTVRLEVHQDVAQAEFLAETGNPVLVDRRDLGFMVLAEPLQTPQLFSIDGPSMVIDGQEGFWSGTHWYPSTSWWEWAWRDFHPLKAAEDFAAIRRAGYRIVRIWVDPVIDEPVLRAMDVAMQLAAENGIVLDLCVFTQWVRKMGFERPSGEHVLFDFRDPRDFNLVAISLRHLDLQRDFIAILARRWQGVGNLLYDLANEVYVKDPDASQMDPEAAAWDGIPAELGTVRDTLLFRRWAAEMTQAIRHAGGRQPVMPGYMFSTMGGGDVYLGNADSPIVPWHSYLPPEQTGLTVQYFDPIASRRPLLLEEFGTGGWNSVAHYDADTHYALAAGAAGAMSYEWGVSWLSRESCFWPVPLRESVVENPDPRWFPPFPEIGKGWSNRTVGMCATPSGLAYGSIYHGTPFPAAAAVALGRLGLMGAGLQRVVRPESVYVVVPAASPDALEPVQNTLKALWFAKAIFGVWQEAHLAELPLEAKAILCPHPLTAAADETLAALRARGVEVYDGAEAWRSCAVLEKVAVTGGEKVDLLARRTATGTLFTLVSKEPVGPVSLEYGHVVAEVGLGDFGLVHVTDRGVVLLEGVGELKLNGVPFCRVERGRLIVASEDGQALDHANALRLMVTEPTRVDFMRPLAFVGIGDGFDHPPVDAGVHNIDGNALIVDDQLARYVVHVTFK